MVIQYARTKSDAVAQLEGSLEEHKKKRLEEKGEWVEPLCISRLDIDWGGI